MVHPKPAGLVRSSHLVRAVGCMPGSSKASSRSSSSGPRLGRICRGPRQTAGRRWVVGSSRVVTEVHGLEKG